ncbi:MAG: hypothetical protein E7601_07560 [Ruminococcaceae bacterium]|nr:hypothetical protein [Oscillospiraceae bacterium]
MKTTKHVNILVAVYYIIIVVAVSLVLNPIYSSVSTDILTKNTMWPGIIELFKSALEFAFYALIFSAIIYSNYISPKKKNYGVLLISVIGIVLKYLSNFIFDIILNGFGSVQSTQIFSVCVYTAIEAAQIIILYCISRRMIRTAIDIENQKRKASRSLGVEYAESDMLPFSSLFDKKNPLMISALTASVIIAVPTVVGRLIYDVFVVGAPTDVADLIWILVYYAFDVLGVFIGYLIIIFALTAYSELASKKEKKKDE